MRRFFIVLFILSLCATAASLYWRSATQGVTTQAARPAPTARSVGPEDAAPAPSDRRSTERTIAEPIASSGPDLALVISIASSIISAAAALLQTWLTARAFPVRRAGE